MTSDAKAPDYSLWDHADLVARVTALESQLREQNVKFKTLSENPPPSNEPLKDVPPAPKTFDLSKHSTRFVALKLMYFGQKYNGFEHTNGTVTPLPTIEEVLWKALRKARLIWPPSEESVTVVRSVEQRLKNPLNITWEGCQYSKCGRTDRGVSAFGQVIGIRVRSSRLKKVSVDTGIVQEGPEPGQSRHVNSGGDPPVVLKDVSSGPEREFDDIKDELPYISILNAILPSDIRILAWCPNPPHDFDARFSCRERRYKYFFTNPAFAPTPGSIGFVDQQGNKKDQREGWLNIELMRTAAQSLVGLHDFRNLCKIDPGKQMTNFHRRITYADIELVEQQCGPSAFSNWTHDSERDGRNSEEMGNRASQAASPGPQVFAFAVHGTAFLWHQVRCMAAILFLIGQGLEKPSLISELLDVRKTPSRPNYEMVSDTPLVLWDCIFPHTDSEPMQDALDWINAGDARGIGASHNGTDSKYGRNGVVDEIWQSWQKAKIDETLSATLLDNVIRQGDGTSWHRGGYRDLETAAVRSQKIFDGRERARLVGKYVPVLQKPRLDSVEIQNAKYRAGRGARRLLRDAYNSQTKEAQAKDQL